MKGKKLILGLGMPVGFALAGALVYMQVAGGAAAAPVKIADPSPGQSGPMLALESRVVNLAPGGTYKYVKLGVSIEVRPKAASFYALAAADRTAEETLETGALSAQLPFLYDRLGQAVSAKTSDELGTTDGRAALKTELVAAFKEILGEEDVLGVFFTDFVMQ